VDIIFFLPYQKKKVDIIFGKSTKGKTDKKFRKQGVVICTTPMINSNIEEPHLFLFFFMSKKTLLMKA
jgi:hypothetical protein